MERRIAQILAPKFMVFNNVSVEGVAKIIGDVSPFFSSKRSKLVVKVNRWNVCLRKRGCVPIGAKIIQTMPIWPFTKDVMKFSVVETVKDALHIPNICVSILVRAPTGLQFFGLSKMWQSWLSLSTWNPELIVAIKVEHMSSIALIFIKRPRQFYQLGLHLISYYSTWASNKSILTRIEKLDDIPFLRVRS